MTADIEKQLNLKTVEVNGSIEKDFANATKCKKC